MPHFHTIPSASGGSKLRSTTQLLLPPPAHDIELLGSLLQLTSGPNPADTAAAAAAACCCSSCWLVGLTDKTFAGHQQP
jgi:hypothetical protein